MNMGEEKKKVMSMVKVGTVLWAIGFLLVLTVFYKEFLGSYSALPDSTSSRTLMTLKLGGIGFILSGVFMALVAIVRVLGMMPEGLAAIIRKE